ncbi:hypothetical protein KP509_24G076200 [Ceratopteris richardii]|uniref:Uncharacterized protein n=1 Tax=Ceratopteris richardii TaxID=49495 RepID=A0A8T2RW77_CERRI|nr:hypothetical protein KP509_24G076200 [Ceratopteris richardii]
MTQKPSTKISAMLWLLLLMFSLRLDVRGNHISVEATKDAVGNDYDIISEPCEGACPEIFYLTKYVKCGEQQLPSYSNCCVLFSCLPDVTDCALHLINGAVVPCSASAQQV